MVVCVLMVRWVIFMDILYHIFREAGSHFVIFMLYGAYYIVFSCWFGVLDDVVEELCNRRVVIMYLHLFSYSVDGRLVVRIVYEAVKVAWPLYFGIPVDDGMQVIIYLAVL